MMKLIMTALLIAASLLSGSTKLLAMSAAEASETRDSGGGGQDHGATCS